MRTVLLISAGALALAGCDRLMNGQTPPPRRAGLWLQTFTRDGHSSGPGLMGPIRVCVDPSSEAKSPIFNYQTALKHAQERHCGAPVATRGVDGRYSFSSTCPMPGGNGSASIKGTASGDFKSSFQLRIESSATYPVPFTSLNSHHETEISGSWLGPCPPDMAPGDMLLANGMKAPGGRMIDPHHGKPPP